jgi:hypothetical protein
MWSFPIDDVQQKKIEVWLQTVVYPPIVEEQLKNPDIAMLVTKTEDGKIYPYGGAVGGDLTYSFTPTSLGTVTSVESWGQKLDITDYDLW